MEPSKNPEPNFPSFSEGLSLRLCVARAGVAVEVDFPSFSEGLSLRHNLTRQVEEIEKISLPFRRDFH